MKIELYENFNAIDTPSFSCLFLIFHWEKLREHDLIATLIFV